MFPFYGFSLVLLMTPERNSRSFSISIVSKSPGRAIKAENGNGINYLVWPIVETESKWWRPRLEIGDTVHISQATWTSAKHNN